MILIVAITKTAKKKVCMCVRNNPKRVRHMEIVIHIDRSSLPSAYLSSYQRRSYAPTKLVWFAACGIILESINLVSVRTDVFCMDLFKRNLYRKNKNSLSSFQFIVLQIAGVRYTTYLYKPYYKSCSKNICTYIYICTYVWIIHNRNQVFQAALLSP